MTAQTKLGGVNREALLRIWFLFYVWAMAGYFFAWGRHWGWSAWLFGSAVTYWLVYRRSALAGIVGYLVSGTAAAANLPIALPIWGSLLAGRFSIAGLFSVPHSPLIPLLYYTGLAVVPTVVLALHVASRHRLLRSFEGSVAEQRHGRTIAPGAYYLVIPR